MGKKNNENKPANPANEAKQAISAIKSFKQPVFAKIVDLGDDPNFTLITQCLELIKKDTDCSILLISAGLTDVVAIAYSPNPDIDIEEWINTSLSTLSREGDLFIENNCGRIKVSSDAFPIKEKETALANSFQYLYKIGAMPKDDESSEEMFNLNDL